MRGRTIVGLAAATALTTGAGAAQAHGNAGKQFTYEFSGRLVVNPPHDANYVTLDVRTGNHHALVKLLGHSRRQSFAVGSTTEFLQWSKGVPTVTDIDALSRGDWVTVRVSAGWKDSLRQIESNQAGTVQDRTSRPNPRLPLFRYDGTLSAVGASSVTVHVTDGDHLALKSLLGAAQDETFTFDAHTVFLVWQGKVPTVVKATDLKPGDRISVNVRAAKDATLQGVLGTPAGHIGEHEPAAQS